MSNHDQDVVITGVGVVVPGANDVSHLTSEHYGDRVTNSVIERFDSTGHASHVAALVSDGELGIVPRRLRKRVDRFCALSLVAAERALTSAGMLADSGEIATTIDTDRVGVVFGNMFGGWEMTEGSMRRLCQDGSAGVSPYIATGWFPTASQGQTSIRWGLRGFSKTVVADTASGAVSVGTAADVIRSGRADIMVAGAAEAPVTPYTWTFCTTSGRMSPTTYRPFSDTADGFTVGEGSVVFVLESARSAASRGVEPLARIGGFASTHAPSIDTFTNSAAIRRSAVTALQRADRTAGDIDYIGLDAQGKPAADAAELAAIRSILGDRHHQVLQQTIKPHTGHLLGAAAAVEIGAAVRSLHHGESTTALVHARGADGTVTSTVLLSA